MDVPMHDPRPPGAQPTAAGIGGSPVIIDVTDPLTGERFIYIAEDDALPCEHPSRSRYVSKACRCPGCRREHNVYERQRRSGRHDAQ